MDSTNGRRDLRLVSRLRTETTAALPGIYRNEKFNWIILLRSSGPKLGFFFVSWGCPHGILRCLKITPERWNM